MKPLKLSSKDRQIWFCSDLHLQHNPDWGTTPPLWKSRGFTSIGEHDSWVRDRWHERIKSDDLVFNLGDATFSDPKGECFRELTTWPGKQLHCWGNHRSGGTQIYNAAKAATLPSIATERLEVYPMTEGNLTFVGESLHVFIDGVSVFMQHYPLFVWPELKNGGIHCHGHCHRRLPQSNPECHEEGKVIDIGVDNAIATVGLPFFTWQHIKAIIALKPTVQRDHH